MAKLKKVKNLKPTGYNVLIDLMEAEEKSKGGIILGKEERNREQMNMVVGQVVAFGPACYKNMESGVNSPEEWGVKVGDWVRFHTQCYTKVGTEENPSLVMILDHDIKGTVELKDE